MKQNPVHSSGKKFRYKIENGVRVPLESERGKMTRKSRREFMKHVSYMERVEAMRPYFGETFTPSAGFNLHNVEDWTPAQKAKITKYYRVMAPRLSRAKEKIIKRYRRKDHLERAILSTLQERLLPGQTAAIYTVDPGETLSVEIKNHAPVVRRSGILQDELRFNMTAFLKDPFDELQRVLAETDATVFKIITGANRSNDTYTRDALIRQIRNWLKKYDEEKTERSRGSFDAQFYGEWLNGIIAYKGVTLKEMRRKDRIHDKKFAEYEKQRQKERSEKAKVERAWLAKHKGKKITDKKWTKSANITGRRGRIK